MKIQKLKLTVLSILAFSIVSCEKECCIYECEIEPSHGETVEKISKELAVNCYLKASSGARVGNGYWLDHLQYTRESSVWDRLFMVAVFDKNTLNPWKSQEHGDYGHINYDSSKYVPAWNKYNFYFKNNSVAGINNLMSFVEDVPDGNYVLFYTFRGSNCQTWLNGTPISAEYEMFLSSIGASVDSLKDHPDNYPYILLFKKGDPSSVQEEFYVEEETPYEILSLNVTLTNY